MMDKGYEPLAAKAAFGLRDLLDAMIKNGDMDPNKFQYQIMARADRKKLSKELHDKGVPNTQIAKLAGVGESTIRRDLAETHSPNGERNSPNGEADSSTWTDEELDHENGQEAATEEEVSIMDALNLGEFALRIKNVNLRKISVTPQLRSVARQVIQAWTKVLEA